MDDFKQDVVVAAAYRPGSAPPIVGKRPVHMLTASCQSLPDWKALDLQKVTHFTEGTGWQHHTNNVDFGKQAKFCDEILRGRST